MSEFVDQMRAWRVAVDEETAQLQVLYEKMGGVGGVESFLQMGSRPEWMGETNWGTMTPEQQDMYLRLLGW
jgi:hypothetical protein